MAINVEVYPPIDQKPYNLPLMHTQWVKEELEILEKSGIIAHSVPA